MHILGNLLIQIYYGFMLETTHGVQRVLLVYFAGALGGSLFSCIWFPYNIAVGASAAIFALLALEVVYFITHIPVIDKKRFILFYPIKGLPSSFSSSRSLSFLSSSPSPRWMTQATLAAWSWGSYSASHLPSTIPQSPAQNCTDFIFFAGHSRKSCLVWTFYVLTLLVISCCFILIFTLPLEDRRICPED